MAQILLVDDDEQMARLMSRVLEQDGHRVQVCTNGLNATAAAPADLILLDVNVPGLDGFDVCRVIREGEDDDARATIVMITGRHDTASKLLAFSVGADDYLVKPIDILELQSRVARWVASRAEHAGLVMRRRREAIREIVTAICHEVNNPLTSAMIGLEVILEEGRIDPSAAEDLRLAREQLVRIREVLASLQSVDDRTVAYYGRDRMIDLKSRSH